MLKLLIINILFLTLPAYALQPAKISQMNVKAYQQQLMIAKGQYVNHKKGSHVEDSPINDC